MVTRRLALLGLAPIAAATVAAILVPSHRVKAVAQAVLDPVPDRPAADSSPLASAEPWAAKLIAAAEAQVGVTLTYDPSYVKIAYPGGDVPRQRGVCTDVIVRAYRDAFGLDLQALVHRDMRQAFAAYPAKWGLKRPDPNIDHRRVPNLQRFFTRQGAALAVSEAPTDYLPGDIVTHRLPGNLDHIALVTARANSDRTRPLLAHNIGAGTRLEDILFAYTLTGHYRFPPAT